MRPLIVIPARLGSTRLPHKPLRLLAGEPLIRAVVRNVLDFGLDADVVVAADDASVVAAVWDLPVAAELTRRDHPSGTDRVREVVERGGYAHATAILNVQGDEPFLPVDAAVGALGQLETGADIGTAAHPASPAALRDRHRVKVLIDGGGRALGFARDAGGWADRGRGAIFQHIGIYAFRSPALRRWTSLPPSGAERSAGLEQLRPLDAGMTIGVAVLPGRIPSGIDTEEDLRMAEACL